MGLRSSSHRMDAEGALSMAEFPAMPLWTDAYLADTGHLTATEHGAYLLLLMAAWRSGGRLPDDDKKLARFAHVTSGQWRRMKDTIRDFFTIEDGHLVQGRQMETLAAVRQKSQSAKNSARAKYRKYNKQAHANAGETQSVRTANQTKSQKEKEEASASSKKATRLPNNFQPDRDYARKHGLSEQQIDREWERFQNYWAAQPGQRGVKLDWQAVWRNWILKAVDDGKRGKANGTATDSADDQFDWSDAEAVRVLREKHGIRRGNGQGHGQETVAGDQPEGQSEGMGGVVSLFPDGLRQVAGGMDRGGGWPDG